MLRGALQSAMASGILTLWVSCSLHVLLVQGNVNGQLNSVTNNETFQPVTSDEIVVAGGTVTLTCRVARNDNSSLQWSNPTQQTLYFGEKKALRDHRIQLVESTPTELTISISSVHLGDEGEYTCSIFTMPVHTAKATVTVLGVPQNPLISGYHSPVKEGEVLHLTCLTHGSKPAARLRWFKGLEELQGKSHTEQDSNGRTFTVISNVELNVTQADDNVDITCSVDHPSLQQAEKTSKQNIRVQYKPSVTIEPEPTMPREGEKFYLRCHGYGNPEPSKFEWSKQDSVLPVLAKADDNFLRFEALNKSDNGVYVCKASNSMGSGSAEHKLYVQDVHAALSRPSLFPFTSVNSALPPARESPSPTASSARSNTIGRADPSAILASSSIDHAVIGGVVAVIVFILLCLLIVLGRYLIRHKGTYLTHEAKGSDDAADADTAIINAEGGQAGVEDKKEYFI
ncbi:cell adhesion molecule 3 isoform X1 [Polypterus senegalus]|uniref:cell adhesion molecule 3 isoform X1 n=1 Tax=Polypterus senegalus TaxID=55291 RepID=UPI00196407E4|nr:cell adhesion molecule 3 isoform X1 [Polypterus senegalus]XP_039597339.1 cell adhesion molecule 3 isoform X1 [Polypterus senegalus]